MGDEAPPPTGIAVGVAERAAVSRIPDRTVPMPPTSGDFDLDDAIAVLERTPATLDAMLGGLPDRWIRATEGPGSWSPYDVVGHLIHGERTDWMVRARHIVAGETRAFAPFDREAQFAMPADEPIAARLATFATLRAENLAALRAMHLTAGQLGLTGAHPAFGTVTLGQLLATWTVHDLTHLAQVARTMAKVFGEAVGPWRAYLSVLGDRLSPGGMTRRGASPCAT